MFKMFKKASPPSIKEPQDSRDAHPSPTTDSPDPSLNIDSLKTQIIQLDLQFCEAARYACQSLEDNHEKLLDLLNQTRTTEDDLNGLTAEELKERLRKKESAKQFYTGISAADRIPPQEEAIGFLQNVTAAFSLNATHRLNGPPETSQKALDQIHELTLISMDLAK